MIVMKFGGTSVQDEAAMSRAMQAVSRHIDQKPVVVLSAMGKTTDRLLAIADRASQGKLDEAHAINNQIREHHLSVASKLVSAARYAEIERHLSACFQQICNIIQGFYLLGECTPRSKDLIASFGERMSTYIFSQAMQDRDYGVELLDSRELVRTDRHFTQATVLQDITFEKIREKVPPLLNQNKLVVLQGFVASTLDGITTTIGRGGSDYTASLVGAALQASDIQIWTDVPGILTADPRIVPEARKIRIISFAEASELAYFGATVLHPSTLLPAVARNIPVHVLSSFQIEKPGTTISAQGVPSRAPVKSIACKKGITIVNVHSTRMLLAHGFLLRIFEVFERHKTVVDVVSTSEVNVSLTIDSTERLEAILEELAPFGAVAVEPEMAIICVVGSNVKYKPGIASRVFTSVRTINVQMISQGASRINVTFLVKQDKMEEAVRRLHAEFFKNPDPELFEPC